MNEGWRSMGGLGLAEWMTRRAVLETLKKVGLARRCVACNGTGEVPETMMTMPRAVQLYRPGRTGNMVAAHGRDCGWCDGTGLLEGEEDSAPQAQRITAFGTVIPVSVTTAPLKASFVWWKP